METTDKENLKVLMDRPIWQMTGREFCELAQLALAPTNVAKGTPTPYLVGVNKLAQYLGCCEATIYAIKREGILDDAIVSQVGRSIVFDGERAREAADRYQKERRGQHE